MRQAGESALLWRPCLLRYDASTLSSLPLPRGIHQYLPRLAWGDAVGNQVRLLQALFRARGLDSEIFADLWDPECEHQVRPLAEARRVLTDDSVLLIHHSFESRRVRQLARLPGRKALAYHNITPALLFEGFDRKLSAACEAAREELLELCTGVERAWGFSRFSAEELVAAGAPQVGVLPFPLDFGNVEVAPDPTLLAELSDGAPNVLFVGRAVPSKGIDDVLRVFTSYQRLYRRDARLVVAGYLNRDTPYGAWLISLRDALGAERVKFLGRVSDAQLSAAYRTASVYLSMSRHEGFGVPLLEAMKREVPVVAWASAAVPETLAGAGLVTASNDPLEVARLLAIACEDGALRDRLLDAQRERVRTFTPELLMPAVEDALQPLFHPHPKGGFKRASAPNEISLICPGFEVRPEAAETRAARALAERLGRRAQVHVLREGAPLSTGQPEAVEQGALQLIRYTADLPVTAEHLPHSSSLSTRLRVLGGRTVLFGAEAAALPTRSDSMTWVVGGAATRGGRHPLPLPSGERYAEWADDAVRRLSGVS